MKRILLAVFMLGTLISHAKDNNTSSIKLDVKRVKVEFKTVKKGQTLSIKDDRDIVIYSQKIKATGTFSQVFDLSNLEEGNYTTELEKDYEILVQSFQVVHKQISFKSKKIIFKPIIRNKEDLILISKNNFENKPLRVVLYYKDNVIFSETVTGKEILKRVYKLSKSKKGNYKVVINTDNRMYIKDFTI